MKCVPEKSSTCLDSVNYCQIANPSLTEIQFLNKYTKFQERLILIAIRTVLKTLSNLSESISSVCPRAMYKQWMKEDCISGLHDQVHSRMVSLVVSYTMVHLVYTTLKGKEISQNMSSSKKNSPEKVKEKMSLFMFVTMVRIQQKRIHQTKYVWEKPMVLCLPQLFKCCIYEQLMISKKQSSSLSPYKDAE